MNEKLTYDFKQYIIINKAIICPSTQQFFFSSSDIIATTVTTIRDYLSS
jgi:hypothetical protein